jgi:hypothetical protein
VERRAVTPIEALCWLFEMDNAWPISALKRQCGASFDALSAGGFLKPAAARNSIECALCDGPVHEVELFRTETGRLAYLCVAARAQGFAEADEVNTLVCDRGVTFEAIASALDLEDPSVSPRVELAGRIWRLGDGKRQGRNWTAFLARRWDTDEAAPLYEAIQRIRLVPALVLVTGSAVPPRAIGNRKLARLCDLLRIDLRGAMRANFAEVDALLDLPAQRRSARGRPPLYREAALAQVDALTSEELRLPDETLVDLVIKRTPGATAANKGKLSPTLKAEILEAIATRRAALH